jgi:hypothetical protein
MSSGTSPDKRLALYAFGCPLWSSWLRVPLTSQRVQFNALNSLAQFVLMVAIRF